jgi:hypothetical protein
LKKVHKKFSGLKKKFYIYSIINQSNYTTMNLSTRPIEAQDLRQELRNGIVKFFFIKKDGSLREVHGTTNLAHVPADKHPQGVRQTPPTVITFWDLLAGDWRSAKTETQFFIKD